MELPKNITQIGESNPHCKIYVEDYVVSYMKQENAFAKDKEKAVALYGVKKEEAGVSYLFIYGASGLQFLQKESRHLSQAVMQEIEKQRKLYFSGYEFLAYAMLNGETPEGFHVYEQGICRYVAGYAGFFEKNDSMLSFMVSGRKEDSPVEIVEQTKYEEVKRRQEERRAISEGNIRSIYRSNPPVSSSLRGMRWSVAAVFALLCIVGLYTIGEGTSREDIGDAVRQLVASVTEQQIPDKIQQASGIAQADVDEIPVTSAGTILAEDNLADAILKENENVAQVSGTAVAVVPTLAPTPETTSAPTAEPTPIPTAEPTFAPTASPTAAPTAAPTATPTPVSYTVQRGDTLLGICLEKYGSGSLMKEICRLNEIDDPDDIKVGDKILLP